MTRWHDTDKTDVTVHYDNAGRVTATTTPQGYWQDRFEYDDEHRVTTYFFSYRMASGRRLTTTASAGSRQSPTGKAGPPAIPMTPLTGSAVSPARMARP